MKGRPRWSLTRTLCKNGAQRRRLFQPLVAVRLDEWQGHPQLESHSDNWRPGHGSLSPPWEVAVASNGAQSSVSAPVAFRVGRPTSMSAKVHGAAPPIRVSPSSLALLLEFFSFSFYLSSCPLTSAYISQAGGGPLGSWVVGGWGRG